jgi:N utilization substance protein A
MNGSELLRVVDAIQRDKNIDKEIVFEGIEQAILSAARKHFGEENEIKVDVDRETGEPSVRCDGEDLLPDEIGELLGRIAAQTAKQVMIQKIREAERDSLYEEYDAMRGQIVSGSVSRLDGGAALVSLGNTEALLPRGEHIPGESHRVGERIRAVVLDVRKAGSRVRIILSRTHPQFVGRMFELEIPEVGDHVIDVRSIAREAGYRSKVAVSCFDSKIDCVGACVGVRGSRIRSIVDELGGERIDIVRWNDSLQVLVPNALQPAEVEDVILCPMLGKVIVLVRDDQLSLAIGKKGQNVRLASKLVGWDIHVMTQERLDDQLEGSVRAFSEVPEVSEELAENLVSQGFFTFDDLSVIEPDQLAEVGRLTKEQCDTVIAYADVESARIEKEEKRAYEEARALRRQEQALAAAAEKERAEAVDESSVEPAAEADSEAETEEAADDVEAATAAEAVEEPTEALGGASDTAEQVPTEAAEPPGGIEEATPGSRGEPVGEIGDVAADQPQEMLDGADEEDRAAATSEVEDDNEIVEQEIEEQQESTVEEQDSASNVTESSGNASQADDGAAESDTGTNDGSLSEAKASTTDK